jgi:hypothetical protein
MCTLRVAIAVLALIPVPVSGAERKPGEEGTPEYQKASDLVRELGHPRFAVREAAAKRLIEMGRPALPALRAGTRSADEEVRARCTALIRQTKAAEWKRRTDDYLADTDGKRAHDLPLLAEWERLTGRPDPSSRALFAQVVRADGDFLDAVAADRRNATTLCAARCQALLDRVRGPKGQFPADPGELIAVLFVDAVDPVWLGLPSPGMPADLLRNPGLAEALGAVGTGPALGRLLARWVDIHSEIDQRPRVEFADLARRKPFPEAVPVLAELAMDTSTRYLVVRLLAVEALGAVGGREAAAVLADLVPDEDTLFGRGRASTPQFGDQALAASLALHGKRSEDFGLRAAKCSLPRPLSNEYMPMTAYNFSTADARAEAIRRWRDEVVGKDEGKK